MLKILKLTDGETIDRMAEKYSLERYDGELFHAVFEDDEVTELIQYTLDESTLEIKFISERKDNLAVIDGLIRTVLFITDPTKVDRVYLPLRFPLTAKLLRFTEYENGYILKLSEFAAHC